WANLHGGFLYGLVLIAAYLLGDLWELRQAWSSVDDRRSWMARARYHLGALGLAVGSSLATPSGPALFAHVTGYLGDRLLVDVTNEYMSPDFHTPFGQFFLVALLFAVVALARSSIRLTWPRLLVVLVNVAFGLYAWRNIPLFAVTA